MNARYLQDHLEGLEKGQRVKVTKVWDSTTHLTKGKEYKVLAVSINAHLPSKSKFLINTDLGKKRWYKFNNTMFEKAGRLEYSKEQREILLEYTRLIEHFTQCWNQLESRADRDEIFERDRDKAIEHYLPRILQA